MQMVAGPAKTTVGLRVSKKASQVLRTKLKEV